MTICPVGAHWFSAHTTYSNSLAQDFSFEKGGVIIDRSDRMNGDSMIFPDENVLGEFPTYYGHTLIECVSVQWKLHHVYELGY
jgi:hypothetical protein